MLLALVLVAAAGAGVVTRYVMKRRSQVDASSLRHLTTFPAIMVFGSTDCASCAPVLETYAAAGVVFTELSWERDAKLFEEVGILSVPTTWGVDARGKVRILVEGTPSRWELKKLELHSAR
jgi:hypothetical protein